jgi:hypothetical protein
MDDSSSGRRCVRGSGPDDQTAFPKNFLSHKMKRLPAGTTAELNALLAANFDKSFKREL